MSERPANRDGERGLARFLRTVGRLKSLRRTGWRDRGVPAAEIESVADHTLRVAVLAWLTAEAAAKRGEPIDPDRVLQLALVHDLAEALAGNIPPYDPASLPPANDVNGRRAFLERRHRREPDRDAAKRAAEEQALAEMMVGLPDDVRRLLADRWREAADRASPESRWVKQCDLLETWIQSREYLARHPDLPMASFAQEIAETPLAPALAHLRAALAASFAASAPPR
jgi:5'-deoxynucleotidase